MLDVNQLEAIIFVAGDDGITVSVLTETFEVDEHHIQKLIAELQAICNSTSRPYTVAIMKNKITMVTKSQFAEIIAKIRKEVEKQPLTKSHLEILSVLLYNGPSAKVDIDAYRGVNSAQAIRSLSLRGMIQKTGTSHGSSVYALSTEMLQSLGITNNEDAPDYQKIHNLLTSATESQ